MTAFSNLGSMIAQPNITESSPKPVLKIGYTSPNIWIMRKSETAPSPQTHMALRGAEYVAGCEDADKMLETDSDRLDITG